MAPKTHKHTLKLKNKPPTVIENDTVFTEAIKSAKGIQTINKLEWSKLVRHCDEEELSDMKQYLKHDKANMSRKIERLGEFKKDIKRIIAVRDFLNECIAKSMELTHDAVVSALDADESEHTVSGVVKLIDIHYTNWRPLLTRVCVGRGRM